MSVGATDGWARQHDVDRVERAVEDLRRDLAAANQRHAELREADLARHAAEHDTIDAQIDAARERHEAEHKAEAEQRRIAAEQSQQKRDRVWTRGIALAAALAGGISAWVAFLVYLHGH